jgi:hypothetical protein
VAVRFNASGENYSRAGNLLGVAAHTVAFYFQLQADRNTVTAMFGVDDAASNYYFLGFTSDGTTVGQDTNNNNVGFTTSVTAATWYYTAAVYDGTSSLTFYLGVYGGGSLTPTTAASVDPVNTGATTYIGSNGFNEWFDGDIGHVRIWSAALSSGELETERLSATAVRTSGLVAAYELLTANTTDDSGNGNTLTANGTPTTSTGPVLGGIKVPLHILNLHIPFAHGYQGTR